MAGNTGRSRNPLDLSLRTIVGRDVRQESRTSLRIHPLPELISYLPYQTTLERGDLIDRHPGRGRGPQGKFLHSGSTRVEIEGRVLPSPNGVSIMDTAGILEIAATLVANLWMTAYFQLGERVLIHLASRGIRTSGIQLMKALGTQVAVTESTPAKLTAAAQLDADLLIDYTQDDFAARVVEVSGADIILDVVDGNDRNANARGLGHTEGSRQAGCRVGAKERGTSRHG